MCSVSEIKINFPKRLGKYTFNQLKFDGNIKTRNFRKIYKKDFRPQRKKIDKEDP